MRPPLKNFILWVDCYCAACRTKVMHNLQRVKKGLLFRNTVITSSVRRAVCKLAFPTAVVCLCVFIQSALCCVCMSVTVQTL